MKRVSLLLLMIFCASLLVYAQDQDKSDNPAGMMQMTGQVCRSTCVTTDAGKSVCDSSCKDKSGSMVFVDDNGKLWKIHDPTKVSKDMMGKKVMVKGKMMGEDTFDVQHIAAANGPG
jgi:hypothetical protein